MADTCDIAAKPKAKARWFQFSLRTLLAATTVFAIWLGCRVKQARDQETAVTAIREAGGSVSYDYQLKRAKPPGPAWFHRLVGIDFSFKAVSVSADHPNMGGAATITDAEMVHFAALRHLQRLNLECQREVTDAGWAHLNGLKKLEELYLLHTNISNDATVHLSTLTNLHTLGLDGTKISDAGLANLSELTSLRNLNLGDTQISDAGLVHLRGLAQIEQLILYNTKVTDAGLPHLAGLTTLKVLGLTKTQVTAEGIRKLQNSLPNCTIGARLEVADPGLGRPLESEGQTKGD